MTQASPTPPPAGPPPPPYPSSVAAPSQKVGRPAWSWIAIIGGCFALLIPILLILAAVTVPSMLSVRKRANETSAIQTMRTLALAEVNYSASYPAIGYACSLAALGGDANSGAPNAQAAQLIDSSLAVSGQRSGYVFAVTCRSKAAPNGQAATTSYQLTAIPQIVGKTGDHGFCSDDSGDIKFDPAGGANCTQSIQ